MALTRTQQFLETTKRCTRPLICLPTAAGIDEYATAIALTYFFSKLEKTVALVADDGALPNELRYLPLDYSIDSSLSHLQQFAIELDASKTPVHELSYELKEQKLCVYISPKSGGWKPSDVSLVAGAYKYDLLVCVGASDLAAFGSLFEQHAPFFFNVPIINIDHRSDNEQFGQINLVDMTASSCGEILHELIESIDHGLVDESFATACLTGMMAKTKSFRHTKVSPKTLERASRLLSQGAKRDVIVDHLYRKRSLGTLRLWGRALARLTSDPEFPLVWTLLSRQDLLHAGAQSHELEGVVEELMISSPQAKMALILHEHEKEGVCGLFYTQPPYHAAHLLADVTHTGSEALTRFYLKDSTLPAAQQHILTILRTQLKKTPTL